MHPCAEHTTSLTSVDDDALEWQNSTITSHTQISVNDAPGVAEIHTHISHLHLTLTSLTHQHTHISVNDAPGVAEIQRLEQLQQVVADVVV